MSLMIWGVSLLFVIWIFYKAAEASPGLAVMLFLVGFWSLAAAAVGQAAEKKGRNRISFFLLSLVISPIITALIVACMRPEQKQPSP